MILSDNETKLDLLNNEAIAKTIVSIIKGSKESVSIGVHGDWGAGKSSILAMVEEEIANAKKDKDSKFKGDCIRFNGWQHQGFEDSKIALMSAIVSQLVKLTEKHPIEGAGHKVKEIAKNLWKNINWLGVAKQVGSIGFSLATGTAPLTILTNAFEMLKGHVDSREHVEEAVDIIGGYIQKASVSEDTSSLKEFEEFRKNFKELLDLAGIEKLVVIIDDLDRCLPTVAIETLEAVRMFMFMEETAFVIGADEVMIRYAVKKHFPDMEREKGVNIGDDFADKYLEKLIQIPFRIPALGPVESQLYTTLLLIGSVKEVSEDKAYKTLVNASLDKLKRPWDITTFSIADIQKSLGAKQYKHVVEETLIAMQISPILYKYSRGNPRVIKRFINMLLLRYAVARNRGYGDDLDLKILAKLMLAEKKWPKLYENIAIHLVNGQSPELSSMEEEYNVSHHDVISNGEKKEAEGRESDTSKGKTESKSTKSKAAKSKKPDLALDWIRADEYKEWICSPPFLKNQDLRPYYTACKEKVDLFGGLESDEALREVVDILMKDEAIVLGQKDKIQGLSEENAAKAFDIVAANVTNTGNFDDEPSGFIGLKILTETHSSLRKNLVGLVAALPPNKVGEWIITGWEKYIPTGCEERKQLESFFDKLNEEGSEWVKTALATKRV